MQTPFQPRWMARMCLHSSTVMRMPAACAAPSAPSQAQHRLPTQQVQTGHHSSAHAKGTSALAAQAQRSRKPSSISAEQLAANVAATKAARQRGLAARFACPACAQAALGRSSVLRHMRKCCPDLLAGLEPVRSKAWHTLVRIARHECVLTARVHFMLQAACHPQSAPDAWRRGLRVQRNVLTTC